MPSTITSASAGLKRDKKTAKRLRDVRNTAKKNLKGSCVMDAAKMTQSAPRMAGYLHLDIASLYKLVGTPDDGDTANQINEGAGSSNDQAPETIRSWVSRFIEIRNELRPGARNNFCIYQKDVKRLLDHPEFGRVIKKMFKDSSTTIPLPRTPPSTLSADKASFFFETTNKWAHLNVLLVVFRMLQLCPATCRTGALCPDFQDASRILGYHPEDWMRGLCLLRFAVSHFNETSSSKVADKCSDPIAPDSFTAADQVLADSITPGSKYDLSSGDDTDGYSTDDELVPTEFNDWEQKERHQNEVLKAMLLSMQNYPFNRPVHPQYLRRVLEGLYEAYGRKSVQYPNYKAEEGPLACFSTLKAQNPSHAVRGEPVDADEPDEPDRPDGRTQDDAESVKRFYELQSVLNKTTAKARSILKACEALKLTSNPKRWLLGGLRALKAHQVLTVDWARAMVTRLGFAYISSDVGLGKTTVAAALVLQLASKERAESANAKTDGKSPVYRPTLVLVPRNGIMSWFDELSQFPAITAHQWYGDPSLVKDRRAIGTSMEHLVRFLNRFNEKDPVTALQVVITTYVKYRSMTMIPKGISASIAAITTTIEADNEAGDNEAGDNEGEGNEAEDNQKEEEGNFDHLKSALEGKFGLIILDEAHKAKNPLSKTHAAIRKTLPDQLLGLTASPIMQTPRDLHGLIELAWQVAACRRLVHEIDAHPSREFYEDLAKDLPESAIGDPKFLPLVHPESFKTHLDYSTAHDRLVSSAKHSQQIVRPIMNFCFLRFHKGQSLKPFGLDEIVGGDIPPYKALVVELRLSQHQQQAHDRTFEKVVKDLHAGSNNESEIGFYECGQLNPIAHKELVQLSSNVFSGRILKKVGSTPSEVVNRLKTTTDSGFRFIFRAIMTNDGTPEVPVYRAGKERAEFICSLHPKWGFLAGILNEVICRQKAKLLVFVSSPFTHQLLDLFLQCLGIKFKSVNSSVNSDGRDTCFKEFNDTKNATKVLTVNTNLGACSFNAQGACHVTVLLDFPIFPSPRLLDQLIGRTWRMGQKKPPIFITVTTVASYDHILQGRFAHKAIVQTAVLADLETQTIAENDTPMPDATNRPVNATGASSDEARTVGGENSARASSIEVLDRQIEENDPNDQAIQALVDKTTPLYMAAYGFASPRHGWHRASLEQLLRQGGLPRAKAGQANAGRANTAPTNATRVEPVAAQDDENTENDENRERPITHQPQEEPASARADSAVAPERNTNSSQSVDKPTEIPVGSTKRPASSELENPSKRQELNSSTSD